MSSSFIRGFMVARNHGTQQYLLFKILDPSRVKLFIINLQLFWPTTGRINKLELACRF